MQVHAFDWFKFNYLASLYLIIILTRIILIIDTITPVTPIPSRQMCSKIQSMLSYGKYYTYQISSNITYVSRLYAQNFLAYSPLDDILIFIEPKHQLYVYNAQSIRFIVNLTITNIVYAASCISLSTNDRYDLYFVYESRLDSKLVSIRVCETRFNIFKLNFEDKNCIETLIIRCDKPDIHINGFTIKRDHAGTKKSILFISTDIGLIYTIFNTQTGSLIREPVILNDTLNEGNVVVTALGIVYYANKQEHTIHELHITRDFRIRYGKIIKSNAIKFPYGLITDECNHLYIATQSMILVMFIQTYTTIRSVFSRASDLSITIERLNSTTYVYATVKKHSAKVPSIWMFNFLSFLDPQKPIITTRQPVFNMEEMLDFNDSDTNDTNIPKLWPISGSLSLMTMNTTKMYTYVSSTPEMSEQTHTSHIIEDETSSTNKTTLNMHSLSTEYSTSISSNEFQNNSSDDHLHFDNSSLPNEVYLTTQLSSDYDTFSKYVNATINSSEQLMSDNIIISNFQGERNLSLDEDTLLQTNLTQQLSSDSNLYLQHINYPTDPTETFLPDDNLKSSSSFNMFSKYVNSTLNSLETLESNAQNLTFVTSSTLSNAIPNSTHHSVENISNDYTTSMDNATLSIDTFDGYPPFSTPTSLLSPITQPTITSETYEDRSTFSPSLSTKDSTQHLHSLTSTSTSLVATSMTQSNFLSSEKSLNVLPEGAFDVDLLSSTLSSHESSTVTEQSLVTEFNSVHYLDQSFLNLTRMEPTQFSSIIFDENTTLFFDVNNEHGTDQSLSTDVGSISLNTTLRTTSEYLSDIGVSHFSPNSVLLSTPPDQSVPHIDDVINSTISLETTSLQNQSYLISTERSNNDVSDDFYNESQMTTHQSINIIQNSTLSMTVTDYIDKEMEDGINQKHSSPMFVEGNVSSTLHPSSPSISSSTTFLSSQNSQLSSPFHPPPAHSSTTSTKLNRLSLSKYFSATTTSMPVLLTTLSSSVSRLQTTNPTITSDITDQTLITTFSDESSSPLVTSYPSDISTASPLVFTTTNDQFTSQSSNTFFESSVTYAISSETSTNDYSTLSTTIITSTNRDFTTTVQSDESLTLLLRTTDDEKSLAITNSLPFATIPVSSPITDEHRKEYTSTQSSLEITSTIFPDVYIPSNRPTERRISELTTNTITTSTTITSTINDPYRIHKQTITRLNSQPSTTITSTSLIQTTSIHHKFLTSSPISIRHSNLNSLQQETIVIKPSLNTNSSNTLLSNELFNTLFNNTTNSSTEKFIYFNLIDLPPSSWNISLHTNESILLDIALPSPSYSLNLNTTTNLTITNVEANRFSTNIIGLPINLQVDQIQAKQFSLTMNLTNNQTNQSLSDIVIGHIKSEQFELNITKTNNMNIHVEQVDSEIAELYFDSQFCTNESNLQINLNLSKNGIIRYGNREPLRIGPVFTRIHMLKQFCDLDQPFTLFFDICQGQNPCLNGGTCKSYIPNYNDSSYSHQQSSQIHYQCICPIHITGEHCQYLQYPFGYCINGGTIIHTYDLNNKSIEKCLCIQGFQGDHCQDNIDDCINIDCSNHGKCQDDINTYKCICFDGFYGNKCEQTNVQTVLLQVASKSFATVAILLISSIAGLVIASDIHTYLTKKKQKKYNILNKLPRATSELFENSVLLLAFGDAPIEISDLSTVNSERKTTTMTTIKQRSINMRKQTAYKHLSKRKYIKTLQKLSSKRYLLSNPSYETTL